MKIAVTILVIWCTVLSGWVHKLHRWNEQLEDHALVQSKVISQQSECLKALFVDREIHGKYPARDSLDKK